MFKVHISNIAKTVQRLIPLCPEAIIFCNLLGRGFLYKLFSDYKYIKFGKPEQIKRNKVLTAITLKIKYTLF